MDENTKSQFNQSPPNSSASPAQVEEPRDKVPVYEKAAWAAGGASDALMTTSIGQLSLAVYNMNFGLSGLWVGLAISIPRLFDAFLDPIMGNISDNTRSRWGRRRPYIFVGGIFVTILYWLIWCPPKDWSPNAIFGYFIVVSSLFFLAYTVYLIPHAGLGFELSADYNERTRIMAYRSFFGSICGLFWPYFLLWSKSPLFGGNTVDGIRWVTAIAGGIMMLCILSTAIFCKERVGTQKQEKIELLKAVKYSLTNKPFMIVLGIIMLVIVSCFLTGPLEPYIMTFYTASGNDLLGAKLYGDCSFFYGIIGLIMTIVISLVATRIGKKLTLIIGISLAIISFALTLIFYSPKFSYYTLTIPFTNVSFILHPLLICKLILNPGLTTVWILGFSMISDVCDIDELKTGLRREGMFGAVYNSLVIKVGISLISLISGITVDLSGFKPGIQPSENIVNNLRYTFVLVPVVLLGIALVLTICYPLTEKRMKEVREQLHQKKLAAAKQA